MKHRTPTPALTPLAEKLPQARTAAAAVAWMKSAPPAPTPLFGTPGQMPSVIDQAAMERQLADAMAEAAAEGERQGWQKAEADVAAALVRLGDAVSAVEATARAMARPYATELVELALIIARELVGSEVKRDPAPLIDLCERSLDDVAGESSITLRMHPVDRAVLLAARPELARGDLRILEDESLARGGCVVESTRRLVDARLEERLDNVRDGLRELLEEAERADA